MFDASNAFDFSETSDIFLLNKENPLQHKLRIIDDVQQLPQNGYSIRFYIGVCIVLYECKLETNAFQLQTCLLRILFENELVCTCLIPVRRK